MSLINNVLSATTSSIGRIPLADKAGTFTPSGTKREAKAGRIAADGGYTEAPVQAKLELNINLLTGIDVQKLNAISNENVTVRLANGEVHLMAGAFCTEPVGVGDDSAKMTLMSNISERIS